MNESERVKGALDPTRTGLAPTRCGSRARQPRLPAGALSRRSPRRTTGTWRSPTPCATACWSAGSARCRAYASARCEGRLLPVGRVPDRPAARQQPASTSASRRARARRCSALGQDLDELLELEEEPGLGNGGLGRLAACYLDSLATLEVPAIGYGIRYEFGIFDQEIRDGWQVEVTDKWLRSGNPWEIVRPDVELLRQVRRPHRARRPMRKAAIACAGSRRTGQGRGLRHAGAGYGVNTCNMLRLWKREAVESFDLQAFNVGDYYGAVHEKVISETSRRCSTRTTSRGRQAAAPRAAVLLRLLLAAGHAAPARPARARRSRACQTSSRSSSTTPTRRSRSPS